MSIPQPIRTVRDVANDDALWDKIEKHEAFITISLPNKAAGHLVKYAVYDCWEANGRYFVTYFDFGAHARLFTDELAAAVTRRVSPVQGLHVEVFERCTTWICYNKDYDPADDAPTTPRVRCGDLYLRHVSVSADGTTYEGYITDKRGNEWVINASDALILAQTGAKGVRLRDTLHQPQAKLVTVNFTTA